MNIRYTSFFILALLSISCGRKTFDSGEEMTEYLKNPVNGYLQQKTVKGVYYALMYKPTDLLVLQELKANSKEDVSQLRKQYGKYMYFTLSMSKNGQELLNSRAGNRAEFGAMVNRLAFGMKDKVHLYTPKKDTLPLLDYIYPRTYGMSPYTTMMFVFPREKKYLEKDELFFTIEDLGFLTGEVKFKVEMETIIKEPQLKI